ncbi:FecR family protein [Methylobacterium sp. J-030]|uniref:FecR family protein n=1 Tax=Methylobacterium sp. J-030 TaxID=2836627 RepID=UPI001FBA7236|nr:FecR family protein [Methylobacterium sp. J-030]MCJ2074046.1 FecR family protein [Methylobacterium sp. J-030]
MNPAVRVCCAATAGILISGVAFAKPADIGKAEIVVPDAKRTSIEQEERSLQVGTDVFKDDVVNTGNIGAVMLKFNDKTTLKIFPNSKVKLDNYVYDADKTVLHVGLNLLSGAMRIASGGPHTADKYQLRTPQATIGIRGTVIHIVADDERTVVEALHGTFYACATTGSACRTVSATDAMNALHLRSDGRIELTRARRDLGVRSAHGSSEASAAEPVLASSAVAPAGGFEAREQAGNDATVDVSGSVSQLLPLNLPVASLNGLGATSTATATVTATSAVGSGQGRTASPDPSDRSSGGPSAELGAERGSTRSESGGIAASGGSIAESFFAFIAEGASSPSNGRGDVSGSAPAPEVNAILGAALTGSTIAFLRRRRSKRVSA